MAANIINLVMLILLTGCFAENVIDVCDCNPTGSLSSDCGIDRQCDCKPGVGGLQCSQCLPGYTGFGDQGCTLIDDCQCHPRGSLSGECDEDGICSCHLGIQGDKCDTCADGFHRIDLGCIPCPTCFDEVTAQFSLTLELYNNLLQQINETLASNSTTGLTPDQIEEIARYQTLLTDLLYRAMNATRKEQAATVELTEYQSEVDSLVDTLNSFNANITDTEQAIDSISLQVNTTQALFEELTSLVSTLQVRVEISLQMQLEELLRLNEQLTRGFEELVRLANEAAEESSNHESLATELLLQATNTLNNATDALQTLREALSIQNQTIRISDIIQNETLPRLEALFSEGMQALSAARLDVPAALDESRQILQTIINITIPQYNLESRREMLSRLQNETNSLLASTTQLNLELDILFTNFSSFNETASRLIDSSQALNNEATLLLFYAEEALSFGNLSVTLGNEITQEARRLLMEIENRLSDGREFTAGLETVIRNIELAEMRSLEAENEISLRAGELVDAIRTASMATALLEEASLTLSNAFQVATSANSSAHQLLTEAQSVNDSATDFGSQVAMATNDVDLLENTVREEAQVITMVADTANEAISAAANLTTRLLIIQDVLTNLTQELNNITLIPPNRILSINATLTSLEQDASGNQILVDSLTEQVRQLQESAEQLRARYIQVQQHRDLLQDILRNVEELNCREQFEN